MRGRVLLPLAFFLGACRNGGGPLELLPDAGESPQAKAEPVPLENVAPTSTAPLVTFDAGPPPVPLRADQPLPADSPPRDLIGWEMDAVLRTFEIPPAFRGSETSITAIDAVKKKTEPHLNIEWTGSRARFVVDSAGFVLPEGTELRARLDRYGHVLMLPGPPLYRIAAPGTLRALFGDRRLDVAPLVPATLVERGEGGRRLGYRTRRVEVTSRAATATFDLARIPEAGEGATLLCRALLDLMNASPSIALCAPEEVPVHVEWKWATKGGLTFDATTLARRPELGASPALVPPAGASFVLPALPYVDAQTLVDPAEITAFRTAAADVPVAPADAGPPERGLSLANASDELRLAWLDGAPIAWVAPGGHLGLPALLRGRYGFAWRAFLGDAYDAPTTINVPGARVAGAADGGAP